MLSQAGFFNKLAAAETDHKFANPLEPKPSPLPAKAKSVIFLFMYGGPSHIDTFDYKPKLYDLDGKTIPVKTFGRGGKKNEGRVVGPKWKFKQYGQCGKWVSDLFPNLATCVDDIAFLHSMTADSPIHGSAILQMNTGKILSGNPCLGSWVNYGLGSVNENLPGFVVMLDPTGGPISGAKNWSSGYMPASFQGTVLRSAGDPILDLNRPEGMSQDAQRRLLNTLDDYNASHLAERADNSNLSARVASYELAFAMQRHAPEAVDLSQEPESVKQLYGINDPKTQEFGRRCLLARRLVERGVRFIQLYAGGAHNDDNWDAHGDLERNHNFHAGRTDKPITGLIKDLKQRGMLDDTLIVWGGEFGRTPKVNKDGGRDHWSNAMSVVFAGGGVPGGQVVGATDSRGYTAVERILSPENFASTVYTKLGIDPSKLLYAPNGRPSHIVSDPTPIRELMG
ncbi:MAG TPA: DUF1501 domain-containing protein [Planctomycetales bacterium]|nr:DUF1501 domain-containing protein [Planctomycetales bacterium]